MEIQAFQPYYKIENEDENFSISTYRRRAYTITFLLQISCGKNIKG
jgi:hypothetical protein